MLYFPSLTKRSSFILETKQRLRQQFREVRANLSSETRRLASEAAATLFVEQSFFKNHQHIACYLSFKDEFDPFPLIQKIWEAGKRCYLPVLALSEDQSLTFARYEAKDELQENRFGILEPIDTSHLIRPEKLEVVVMPLIAFDRAGHRLGSGGGFYDRTFAFLQGPIAKKPLMVGLGYANQEAPILPHDPWDIRMDVIVTEQEVVA